MQRPARRSHLALALEHCWQDFWRDVEYLDALVERGIEGLVQLLSIRVVDKARLRTGD